MLLTILALGIGVLGAAQSLAGDWSGTLTYRDFGTGRGVVLPTTLRVVPHGDALRFSYVYRDGPRKVVRDTATVTIDPTAGTYRVRDGRFDDIYRGTGIAAFASAGHGALVLSGTGDDNAKPVEVRETVALDRTALVMRRDVRAAGGAFFTRHVYRFTRRLSPQALLADARLLDRIYGALHPGLYRYNTPASTRRHVAQLRRALARAGSLPAAYLAFARFTATLRCGHTYPNFFNQPDAFAQAVFGGANRLPFFFTWQAGRMIVTRNFSGQAALRPGSEIVAIDRRRAGTILATLLPFARADGSNDAKRVEQLGVSGGARYEAFDVYYPLAFPSLSAAFDLRVRPFGEPGVRTLRVDAQSDADRTREVAAAHPAAAGPAAPLWMLRGLGAHSALLDMPTWVTYNTSWDWRRYLQTAFERLAADRTRDLIIDLRGNEGGTSEVALALAAHLIASPASAAPVRRLVRYRVVPPALAPYLSTYDPSFKNWGTAARPYSARFFALADAADDAPIAPRAPRFTGRVWILVDAANSSATFDFDRFVKRRKLAMLVGSTTGGNLRGSNGGGFFFVHLPNTGIEADLPIIGTFALTPQPDAALAPDLPLSQTPRDIAAGRDAVLRALLAHIHRLDSASSGRPAALRGGESALATALAGNALSRPSR